MTVLVASPTKRLRRRWSRGVQGRDSAPGFAIHEAARRVELERSMAGLKPAVLLLDLALPELGGLGGVAAIRRLSPRTKVVLLDGRADGKELISALQAGARGYCHREIEPSLLQIALQMIEKGEIWVEPTSLSRFLEELVSMTRRGGERSPHNSEARLDCLTPREREIARLVGGGSTNKEIATSLRITESTVKAHLTAVFRKLGLSDRLRLALFVGEHSWAFQ